MLLWFTLSTALVFVGLALILDHGFYNGQAVYTVPLWRYYVLEIQLAWRSSGNLGRVSLIASCK